MTSKERIRAVLLHRKADRTPLDFGATTVTGIHILVIEKLREYYGFEKRPVKLTEPYQMLGEIDDELLAAMNIDVIGFGPRLTMFGFPNEGWKEFRTFWGQEILVPEKFITTLDENGDLLIYPQGDVSFSPSGKMPKSSYFFDAIIRQGPVDEEKLNPEDNLEEYGVLSDEDLQYWNKNLEIIKRTDKAVVANIGGTGIGDIALVPGTFLKQPKGIRDVAEWYMSTVMRPDYIRTIFEKQTDIAIKNLETVFGIVGNEIDILYVCGTDFGTQNSTFCSPETFDEMWLPYYKKINDWVHENTGWKTFKHSCGAVEILMDRFIRAGFDIINPVQINARGMDTRVLKEKYGDKLVFWGGGVDTQKVLPFGEPEEVKNQVFEQCVILSEGSGFVFNTVHNIQANVPVENVVAMLEALKEFNKQASHY
ncbi:MAG: methyltransferase [Bacteroidales bacterium]|nr:methyltransferase [Bacteroidales bacterium]